MYYIKYNFIYITKLAFNASIYKLKKNIYKKILIE